VAYRPLRPAWRIRRRVRRRRGVPTAAIGVAYPPLRSPRGVGR